MSSAPNSPHPNLLQSAPALMQHINTNNNNNFTAAESNSGTSTPERRLSVSSTQSDSDNDEKRLQQPNTAASLSRSNSSLSLKRKAAIQQFLRAGESNESFANKAPSIVPAAAIMPIMSPNSPRVPSSRSPTFSPATNNNFLPNSNIISNNNNNNNNSSPHSNKADRKRRRKPRHLNGNNNGSISPISIPSSRLEKQHLMSLHSPFLEERAADDYITYDYAEHAEHHLHVIDNREMKYGNRQKALLREQRRAKKREQRKKKNEALLAGNFAYDSERENESDASSQLNSDSESDDLLDNNEDNDYFGNSARKSCKEWFLQYRIVRFVYRLFLMSQGWILAALIGVVTGVIASFVNLAAQWTTDLRSGYCNFNWLLPNNLCCAGERSASIFAPDITQHPLLMNCGPWRSWTTQFSSVGPFMSGYIIYVLFSLSMAIGTAFLVKAHSRHAKGSGIPEIKTILGGVIIKKYLGLETLLTKSIGLILVMGSGLSVGKEAPFVHIACCVSNVLSRLFPAYTNNQYKKNEALSAAAAAGISVAFGAPIGGVLFSLEEVSSYFPHKTMWRSFFAALISSVTLQYIDPYETSQLVLFQIDYDKTWWWFEMFPFLVIGGLGGMFGALFNKLNTMLADFRKKSNLSKWEITDVAVVAFITAVLKYQSSYLRGNQNALLSSLFGDCDVSAGDYDPLNMCDPDFITTTALNLLLTSCLLFFLTLAAYSLAIPGGIWIPAMLFGGSLGRLVGTSVMYVQQQNPDSSLFSVCSGTSGNCITPGIYAIVGSAAMLGGVTRMTVCLVVIMFELTGGLYYIAPIMASLIASKVVADWFNQHSIYEMHLKLHNLPFLDTKVPINPELTVGDVCTRDLFLLPMHGHTVETLRIQMNQLAELHISGFPIVTSLEERLIVGYITRSELSLAIALSKEENPLITEQTKCYFAMAELRFPKTAAYIDLHPYLHSSPIQVVEHMPLVRLQDMFKKLGLRYALVTRFGKLVGIITKKDIMRISEEDQIRQKEIKQEIEAAKKAEKAKQKQLKLKKQRERQLGLQKRKKNHDVEQQNNGINGHGPSINSDEEKNLLDNDTDREEEVEYSYYPNNDEQINHNNNNNNSTTI